MIELNQIYQEDLHQISEHIEGRKNIRRRHRNISSIQHKQRVGYVQRQQRECDRIQKFDTMLVIVSMLEAQIFRQIQTDEKAFAPD